MLLMLNERKNSLIKSLTRSSRSSWIDWKRNGLTWYATCPTSQAVSYALFIRRPKIYQNPTLLFPLKTRRVPFVMIPRARTVMLSYSVMDAILPFIKV